MAKPTLGAAALREVGHRVLNSEVSANPARKPFSGMDEVLIVHLEIGAPDAGQIRINFDRSDACGLAGLAQDVFDRHHVEMPLLRLLRFRRGVDALGRDVQDALAA